MMLADNTPAVIETDGWEVTVIDSGESNGVYEDSTYFDQNGHKIFWILSIDTSRIDNQAAKDVVLTVVAQDSAGGVTELSLQEPEISDDYIPGSTKGSRIVSDGVTNVPVYQMDVMPYITKITTALSSLKKNNSSVYARTASGHYSVRSTETVTFEGFNLNGTSSLDISTVETSGTYDFAVTYNAAVNMYMCFHIAGDISSW